MSKNNKSRKKTIFIFIAFLSLAVIIAIFFIFFNNKNVQNFKTPFEEANQIWVDSVLNTLNTDEKIGQLIMYSNQNDSTDDEQILIKLIEKFSIGSCVVKKDSLKKHFEFIDLLQSNSKIPLLIANSSENIYPDFISDIQNLPNQDIANYITLDSILNNYYEIVAQNLSKLSYNINFYNDNIIDLDSIPFDSMIIKNSFENFLRYSKSSYNHKIINIVPFVKFAEGDSIQKRIIFSLYKNLILNGLCGLNIERKDMKLHESFTENFDFEGLHFMPYIDETDLENFFNSDIDILIIGSNYETNIKAIIDKIKNNSDFQNELDKKVRNVLLAKSWCRLNSKEKIDYDSTEIQLNSAQSKLINRYLYENSLILVNNKDTILPFVDIEKKTFYIITIGTENCTDFETYFRNYINFESKFISIKDENYIDKITVYPTYNTVIFVFNNFKPDSVLIKKIENLNLTNKIIINFGNIENLKKLNNFSTVVQSYSNTDLEQQFAAQLLFGGVGACGKIPYNITSSIKFGEGLKTEKTRLKYTIPEEVGIMSVNLEKIDSIVMNAIYGGATPGCQVFVAKNGKIIYNKAFGYHTYSKAEVVLTSDLYDIASVTKVAATTLASMKMIEQGKLDLDAQIGKYFKNTKIEYTRIKPDTIINIDTLELKDIKDMKKLLKYQDTLHLTDSIIIAYDTLIVTATPSNNIFKVTPRDLLLHKSGVQPAMPILRYVLYKQNYISDLKTEMLRDAKTKLDTSNVEIDYLKAYKEAFSVFFSNKKIKDSAEVQIAESMYLNKSYVDTFWIDTKQLRNYSRKIFQYSDVNMILLQQTIDTINDYNIEKYMKAYFYNPLGMTSICFQPRDEVAKSRIIPTEYDKLFRNQLLVGYVHDPSAAMLGGVAGNAGLFSSAQDLGVLFQMLLNGGVYGGEIYLQQSTINLFVKTQEDSNRGLGFDKPYKNTIIADGASPNSYGHTGFTGCCVWVDPDEELVYVFLSNRVNPTANNWRLNTYKVRQKVHQAIYDAIEEGI